ncbi:Translation initiation inhibitor [Paraburkholderia caribensis MBA4]|uniref:Translation initiation inhibitor n=1 Tax=Paraburkholderia caribensis MBA4 TaxID=1323664 RepID=A0A0P0RI50_9BURK|nr:RidA family protein [Paraburkholderia caribensis]ALL68423.1 Translation initiation inhibitor [Paraburkholderia caribensis MBA4]
MSDIKRVDFRKRIHMGVVHQGVIYLTGQVGTAGKAAAEQMSEILSKVEKLLEEAGSNKSRILNATLILADVADYDAVNEVWDQWVDKENAPARSTLQAQLASKSLLVELIVVAAA